MEPVCVVPASEVFSRTLRGAMADHQPVSQRLLKAQELSSNIALCGGCEGDPQRIINARSLVAAASDYLFAARSWFRCIRGPDIGIRGFKGSNVRILGLLGSVNFCRLKTLIR